MDLIDQFFGDSICLSSLDMPRRFHTFEFKLSLILAFFGFATQAIAQPPHPRAQNEPFVIKTMVKLHAAQATYSATAGNGNYGTLAQLDQAGLIDRSLAEGRKYHYLFVVTSTAATSNTSATFVATATPAIYRRSGQRSFFINQTGELRGGDKHGDLATSSDPYIDSCALWGLNDNERCTIPDMRSLSSAQETFRATAGNGNYGTLDQLAALGLIRSDFADYVSRGYLYVVFKQDVLPPNQPAGFYIKATPLTYGVTGRRSFFIDESGVLRAADKNGASADENDPPL